MNTLKFLGTNSNPKASSRLLEVIIATNKKKDTQNSVFQYFFRLLHYKQSYSALLLSSRSSQDTSWDCIVKYSGIDLLGSSPGGPKPSKMSILPNSLLFFTIWKTIFGVRCIQNDDTVPTCILGTPTHLQWSIIASFKVNLNKNTEKRCCGVFFLLL